MPLPLQRGKNRTLSIVRSAEVDEQLELDGAVIERHEQLSFLGNCIKVKKDSLGAFYHRQAAGNSCFHEWWPVLRSKMLPRKRRVHLLFAGPFLAATWHSETWTMSPEIAKLLTSWVRYKLGQMVGIHLKIDSEEGISAWWTNIHRAGKVALRVCERDPVRQVFNNQWRFGHLSRLTGPSSHNCCGRWTPIGGYSFSRWTW